MSHSSEDLLSAALQKDTLQADHASVDHAGTAEPSRTKRLLRALLPLVVLALGAGATAALVMSRKAPERTAKPVLGPLVEVAPVRLENVRVEVTGQGEVSPKVRVDLASQVGGRVVAVDPALVVGGRFRAGRTLLRIEPRDYELAVERARAAVAGAQTTLDLQLAEADAARAEWEDVHGAAEPPDLLVRGPQIREARARLDAARADLAAAELALERTRLSLPFDGVVIDEAVDIGQMVVAGQRVATIFGTEAVEIRLPLDDRELAWFDLDGENPVTARVEADFAGRRHAWTGRVDRLEGQVDPRSRQVRLVVEVDHPFDGEAPLLPGTFVDIAIAGRFLEGVAVVPRHALRKGDTVWIAAGDKLEIRPVEVLRREREQVLVRGDGEGGLAAGELLVVSALDAATDGMKIRTPESATGEGDQP